MTSNIKIGQFINVKPSSVRWHCSVSNYKDECTVELPLKTYIRNNFTDTPTLPKAETAVFNQTSKNKTVFAEGEKIEVRLGYNGINSLRFKGFIKRINYAKPLALECEGYSYQLRNKMFTKSYSSVTMRQILADLISGTDIQLSDRIPQVTLKNVVFKNCPALKVLDWFAKECLMAVFFDFDTLYVGASKQGIAKPTKKLKVGWNTVEDKELKKDTTETDIHIHLTEKSSTGTVKRTKSEKTKYSDVKEIRVRAGLPDSLLKDIANELQKYENYNGYKGDITAFLVPHFEKAYVAEILDENFQDRCGNYFVESIEGSFDERGGRQKLTLRYYGKV